MPTALGAFLSFRSGFARAGSRRGSTMCVLAMLFPVVNYPLLLFLGIPVLYFVFACVCNIALGVPILFFLAALRQGTATCYYVSTALRTIVEIMIFFIGCVVFILRQLTAMCYETAALCALTITWVLSALCARMYFFISALRGLAISWLSIASAQLLRQYYKPGGLLLL